LYPEQEAPMTRMTGAEALIKSLEYEGVEVAFGVPGGAILPAYDPLLDSPIRHVLARHEQGAGHMAQGYAHATGRVGVVIATSGPGATNILTPLQDALMDSVPLVAITGQVALASMGNDAFQEAPTIGMAMHCTKHAYLITDINDLRDVMHEAFHLASTGRKGPVLIDIPKDLLAAEVEWREPGPIELPGYRPSRQGHSGQIQRAVDLIMKAQQPVLYVGGGVVAAGATAELLQFAEATNTPVTTTLMARGGFPDAHRLALGMPGMHGTYTAVTAIQKADLLIALGARFDDRVTGDPASFAPEAQVIHVDIDPAEIGKVRNPEVPIVGDVKVVLEQLHTELEGRLSDSSLPDRSEWLNTIATWQTDYPLHYDQAPGGPIKAQYAIEELLGATEGDAIVVSGVGQHQMWASQFWQFSKPRTWINSGGLGTMGFAVPAAIGAKVGMPEEMVVAIDGDGSFQMTFQEMVTAAAEGVPIKVMLINNGGHGMVRQWQTLFYDRRFSATDLSGDSPNYPALAEACGWAGLSVDTPDEVGPAIRKMLSIGDKPVLLEVRTDPEEMVFPMVPAGGSCSDIALGPEDL
jgi:acetolactate synthase I/II/III large subunit